MVIEIDNILDSKDVFKLEEKEEIGLVGDINSFLEKSIEEE